VSTYKKKKRIATHLLTSFRIAGFFIQFGCVVVLVITSSENLIMTINNSISNQNRQVYSIVVIHGFTKETNGEEEEHHIVGISGVKLCRV
jgi:hypothetical protein